MRFQILKQQKKQKKETQISKWRGDNKLSVNETDEIMSAAKNQRKSLGGMESKYKCFRKIIINAQVKLTK